MGTDITVGNSLIEVDKPTVKEPATLNSNSAVSPSDFTKTSTASETLSNLEKYLTGDISASNANSFHYDTIYDIQLALRNAGYNVIPDGDWGQATTDAVAAFNKYASENYSTEGLPSDGTFNSATAEVLRYHVNIGPEG